MAPPFKLLKDVENKVFFNFRGVVFVSNDYYFEHGRVSKYSPSRQSNLAQ